MGKGICLSSPSNLDTWLDIYSYSAESLFTKLEHGREGERCTFSRDDIRKCYSHSLGWQKPCVTQFSAVLDIKTWLLVDQLTIKGEKGTSEDGGRGGTEGFGMKTGMDGGVTAQKELCFRLAEVHTGHENSHEL